MDGQVIDRKTECAMNSNILFSDTKSMEESAQGNSDVMMTTCHQKL